MIIEKSIEQESIVRLLIQLESADIDQKEIIKKEISRRNLSAEELQKAEKEYKQFKKFINKEENKELPWHLKFSCIIIPFSVGKTFGSDNLPERDIEMLSVSHNKKQRLEIIKYSFIGIIIYALLAILGMSYLIIMRLLE